jgi:DNA polymerase-1
MPQLLTQQSHEIGKRLLETRGTGARAAGQPFNLNSPKQLAEILFDKLGLPVKKKTPSGTPSTDEEVLSELALDYPLPKILLESRQLAKLKGTYTDKLPKMVNAGTGRVHTSYAQAVAVTGRLASSDPNLQNIPVRTAEGRRIRAAFIAPPGSQHRLGRLFADRAAHHGAPLRGRAPARSLRAGRGRASGDRRRDLRRHAE